MPDDPLDLAPQMVPFVTGSELERQYQGTIPPAARLSESPTDRQRQSSRPAIDPAREERAQPRTARPEHHCCNDRELLIKTRGGPPYSWHHEYYCPKCNKVFHQETIFGPMIQGPQPPGRQQ